VPQASSPSEIVWINAEVQEEKVLLSAPIGAKTPHAWDNRIQLAQDNINSCFDALDRLADKYQTTRNEIVRLQDGPNDTDRRNGLLARLELTVRERTISMFPPTMAVLVALVAVVLSRSTFILLPAGICVSLTISSMFLLWSLATAATYQLGLHAKVIL
jgi:hypothetical protein